MKDIIIKHDTIVDRLIKEHGGKVIDHAGDGVFAVFEAGDPLGCGLAIQQTLQTEDWGEIGDLRVRVAVHAGRPQSKQDFRGRLVNRTARIMACGWGGQILVTPEATRAFPMPPEAQIKDHGEHTLKDLSDAQQIHSLQHSSLKLQTFPALRSLSSLPNNLPRQPNPFVGRDDELQLISDRLGDHDCRLLTLTGPGGIGKSRLALQSAADQLGSFSGGIYLVYLSPLSSSESVPAAIADALHLNLYGRDEITVQLIRHLKGKRMLLVLDNFEHVMEATELVVDLLEGAPELKLLVTSRERLGLPEESCFPLKGMPFPRKDSDRELESYSSVRLFVERARSASLDFAADLEDLAHVGRICALVEGMPLGIELAAAWTRMISCAEIAEEIERSVDFLVASGEVEERHRSLRAVFEYSWGLIGDAEREAFRRLSVFRGGFTREAAREVVSASLSSLSALLDKSLIRREGASRFTVHELLRQVGAEKLSEDPTLEREVRAAHSDYFTAFVASRRSRLRGREVKQAAAELRQELDNVRSGWSWALDTVELKALDRGIEELVVFFETQSRLEEGRAFFERTSRALEALAEVPVQEERRWQRLMCMALAAQSLFLGYLGRGEEAMRISKSGLDALADGDFPVERGYCLYVLSAAEQQLGIYDRAVEHLEASVAVLAGLEDPYREAHSRISLASLYIWLGEQEKAGAELRFAFSTCASIGDVWAKSIAQIMLGNLARQRGEWDEAKQLLEDSLAFVRDVGDRRWLAMALVQLAMVAQEEEAYEASEKYCREAMQLNREIGDPGGETTCLGLLGRQNRLCGSFEKAEEYLVEALMTDHQPNVLPETLDVMLELAELRNAQGETGHALELLGTVLVNSGSKRSTLVRAADLRERLEEECGEQVVLALATAAYKQLGEVVDGVINMHRRRRCANL
jgi:predicted ATPase